MAELHGSKRTAERATYTPIKLLGDRPVEGRAWDKWSYVAALSRRPQEVRQIEQRFPNANENERQHLATLQTLIEGSDETPTLPFESGEKFRDIPETLLQRIGDELLGIRKQALDEAAAVQAQLLAARAQASSEQQTPSSAQAAAITPHVVEPRRTRVGAFVEGDAWTLDELEDEAEAGRHLDSEGPLLPVEMPLNGLPELMVTPSDASKLARGMAVLIRGRDAPVLSGLMYATCHGRIVALGEVEKGALHPIRVFNLG